jgi:hypothetical protein
MTKCVYNTDHLWLQFLRSTNTPGPVNFWRKDMRRLHLDEGSQFYFRIRPGGGTYYIAGEAEFQTMKSQSAKDAWNEFNYRNGLATYEEFLLAMQRVLHIAEPSGTTQIMSIVLDRCIWYADDSFVEIPVEVFPPQTLASMYFEDTDLAFLPNRERRPTSLDIVPLGSFNEGALRLASHQKRERSSRLIEQVKRERKWICEICKIDFLTQYGVKYIEAHHKVPLSQRGESISTPIDIALLCANCHSAIHKYMVAEPNEPYEAQTEVIRKFIS